VEPIAVAGCVATYAESAAATSGLVACSICRGTRRSMVAKSGTSCAAIVAIVFMLTAAIREFIGRAEGTDEDADAYDSNWAIKGDMFELGTDEYETLSITVAGGTSDVRVLDTATADAAGTAV